MPRLSTREKRLIVVLVAVGVMAAIGFYLAPKKEPDPEELMAYYLELFETADQVTIRAADDSSPPITVSREETPRLFFRMAGTIRFGGVSGTRSPYKPKWILDLRRRDGRTVEDIGVSVHLDSPKQPARGKLWVVPAAPGQTQPSAALVEVIDEFLDERSGKTPEAEEGGKAEEETAEGSGGEERAGER